MEQQVTGTLQQVMGDPAGNQLTGPPLSTADTSIITDWHLSAWSVHQEPSCGTKIGRPQLEAEAAASSLALVSGAGSYALVI